MKQVLLALMLISVVYSQQDMITSDPFPRWENDVIAVSYTHLTLPTNREV